jgi:hypothetical protein
VPLGLAVGVDRTRAVPGSHQVLEVPPGKSHVTDEDQSGRTAPRRAAYSSSATTTSRPSAAATGDPALHRCHRLTRPGPSRDSQFQRRHPPSAGRRPVSFSSGDAAAAQAMSSRSRDVHCDAEAPYVSLLTLQSKVISKLAGSPVLLTSSSLAERLR